MRKGDEVVAGPKLGGLEDGDRSHGFPIDGVFGPAEIGAFGAALSSGRGDVEEMRVASPGCLAGLWREGAMTALVGAGPGLDAGSDRAQKHGLSLTSAGRCLAFGQAVRRLIVFRDR